MAYLCFPSIYRRKLHVSRINLINGYQRCIFTPARTKYPNPLKTLKILIRRNHHPNPLKAQSYSENLSSICSKQIIFLSNKVKVLHVVCGIFFCSPNSRQGRINHRKFFHLNAVPAFLLSSSAPLQTPAYKHADLIFSGS